MTAYVTVPLADYLALVDAPAKPTTQPQPCDQSAGLASLNAYTRWHPDDLCWDQPVSPNVPPEPRWPICGAPSPEALGRDNWRPE